SQLTSFSPNGSGKRSMPFYIAKLQIFFLLLLLHPLWQINLHLSSQIKSPNSTLLCHQQLTPHHHTLNHLLYHVNLSLSVLPQLTISPDSSIRRQTNSATLILFLCLSSSSAATFLHRSSQTLSIRLFPLVNFHLSSNMLLSLL